MSEPDYKERKVIVVDSCESCPFNLQCEPWKKLSKRGRFALVTGVGVGKFILHGCPLPYGEDNAEATNLRIKAK